MAIAVELFWDKDISKTIGGIWQSIGQAQISSHMSQSGYHPHITLAGIEIKNERKLFENLESLCKSYAAIEATAPCFSVFPREPATLFLGITPTETLLSFHKDVYKAFDGAARDEAIYYRPQTWIPHSTLAFQLSREKALLAFQKCLDVPLPLNGRFEALAIVEIPGGKVLKEFRLGGT